MASRGGAASPDFDDFYTGAAPRIARQLALLTGDLAEAEDLTHEVRAEALALHQQRGVETFCDETDAALKTYQAQTAHGRRVAGLFHTSC